MRHNTLSVQFYSCRSIYPVKLQIDTLRFRIKLRFLKAFRIDAFPTVIIITTVLTVNGIPGMRNIAGNRFPVPTGKKPVFIEKDFLSHSVSFLLRCFRKSPLKSRGDLHNNRVFSL